MVINTRKKHTETRKMNTCY